MDDALRYLTYAPRTVHETQQHLAARAHSQEEIDAVVERLKELKLLDDTAYCTEFVRSRLRTKPVSRRHIADQLRGHGADRDAIEDALLLVDDETERRSARLTAERFLRQFEKRDESERTECVRRRLTARGFDYDLIRSVLEELDDDYRNGD